jgi:creatinine amidohydrolase
MKWVILLLSSICVVAIVVVIVPMLRKNDRGVLLENLSWKQAQQVLQPDTIVVIPLGARLKEHGPHLRLNNDWLMAEYLKRRVLESENVVVLPTIEFR